MKKVFTAVLAVILMLSLTVLNASALERAKEDFEKAITEYFEMQ